VGYTFALSDAVRQRLSSIDSAIAFPATATLVVSPLPQSALDDTTGPSRRQVSEKVLAELGPRWQPLETPVGLDDRLFSTLTHLNEEGRQLFTEQLADVLPRWSAAGTR
jgi:hypothetical protein